MMRWPIVATATLLIACSNGGGAANDSEAANSGISASPKAGPAYGSPREMLGIWTVGFEVSAFVPCDAPDLDQCSHLRSCWFEPTAEFAAKFRRLTGSPPTPGNRHIRFVGQEADDGSFGHMGGYPCQVQGVRLISVRGGPPGEKPR